MHAPLKEEYRHAAADQFLPAQRSREVVPERRVLLKKAGGKVDIGRTHT